MSPARSLPPGSRSRTFTSKPCSLTAFRAIHRSDPSADAWPSRCRHHAPPAPATPANAFFGRRSFPLDRPRINDGLCAVRGRRTVDKILRPIPQFASVIIPQCLVKTQFHHANRQGSAHRDKTWDFPRASFGGHPSRRRRLHGNGQKLTASRGSTPALVAIVPVLHPLTDRQPHHHRSVVNTIVLPQRAPMSQPIKVLARQQRLK